MRKKSTSEMNTIGFVGVGRMGSNMARRLRDQGYTIGATYDVNTQAAQRVGRRDRRDSLSAPFGGHLPERRCHHCRYR